jgi:hypothetical protein
MTFGMQPGCVGFNTGGGDIYGMSTTSGSVKRISHLHFRDVDNTKQYFKAEDLYGRCPTNPFSIVPRNVSTRVQRVLEAHLQLMQLDVMVQILFTDHLILRTFKLWTLRADCLSNPREL